VESATPTRTILVVEDLKWCATTLEIALLIFPDVDVCVVNSAQEALGVLGMADFSVSLLITDLHLPAMDGFELIERVRADGRTANLPIVVASGDPDPSTAERVYRLGANAYFCKPYSVAQLCQTVEALLGRGTEHCRDRSAWPAGREIRLSNDG
jgi:CheY-like chemotaxis protein